MKISMRICMVMKWLLCKIIPLLDCHNVHHLVKSSESLFMDFIGNMHRLSFQNRSMDLEYG